MHSPIRSSTTHLSRTHPSPSTPSQHRHPQTRRPINIASCIAVLFPLANGYLHNLHPRLPCAALSQCESIFHDLSSVGPFTVTSFWLHLCSPDGELRHLHGARYSTWLLWALNTPTYHSMASQTSGSLDFCAVHGVNLCCVTFSLACTPYVNIASLDRRRLLTGNTNAAGRRAGAVRDYLYIGLTSRPLTAMTHDNLFLVDPSNHAPDLTFVSPSIRLAVLTLEPCGGSFLLLRLC